MVRILLLAVFSLLFYTPEASASTLVVRDSVGVQNKNGKLFVQHKVEPKETLFALSRKYGVPIATIVESNPSVQTSINIGQIVLIPRKTSVTNAVASTAKVVPAAASNRTFTVNEKGDKLHTVEAKQTLYSISRMHNVSIEDMKKWNNMTSEQVNAGSVLVVGRGMATASKQPIYVPESDEEMVKPTQERSTETTATPVASTAKDPVETPQPAVTERTEETTTAAPVKRMFESGMAEMIDPKADTNKYLALHRSAPIGTIMQVKNAMNDRVVYVRVIGKLPETGVNDKVLVKISKKAYQSLGAVDQKFRVDISYLP
jgi:LysM repeat protein